MTALRLGARLRDLEESDIRRMTLECTRRGGINLSQGVCDTPVPEVVRRAAARAIEAGVNQYTRYDGLPELRAEIARALRARGVAATGEGDVVVTSGSSSAFYGVCLALLDPGDEVVIFEPGYGYHAMTLRSVGATPRPVPLEPPDWTFSDAALERAVGPRARAIVVNTPMNPTGKVFTREELERIAAVAERHDLFVVTDEIYEHFVYDGRSHVSPASLPSLAGRTLTLGGYSKTFSVTGWRIGYSAGPEAILRHLGLVNDLVYICAPAPLQAGVAAGLAELGPDHYEALRAEYAAKRDAICGALDRAGLPPIVPQGAYYVLADVSRLPGSTGLARALELLGRTGVAAVPGTAFFSAGGHGDALARFCFAKRRPELDEACRRLERLRG